MLGLSVVAMCFVAFAPGYDVSVVKSESMKPSINMGDLVITGPVSGLFSNDIKPGTIVSYQTGQNVVTHRVISVENNSYVTKGDAVEDPDPQPVQMSQVVGVYLFKIPKLGYVSYFIHTKLGWFVLIILPAVLVGSIIIKEIIKEATIGAKPKAKEGSKCEVNKTNR
jgi:signal peptidase